MVLVGVPRQTVPDGGNTTILRTRREENLFLVYPPVGLCLVENSHNPGKRGVRYGSLHGKNGDRSGVSIKIKLVNHGAHYFFIIR